MRLIVIYLTYLTSLMIAGCSTQRPAVMKRGNALAALDLKSPHPGSDHLIDNASIWKDDAGHEILAQGGSMIMGRGKYAKVYNWFGIAYSETDPRYGFVALNRYTSTDLKNWHKEAVVFNNTAYKEFPGGKWAGRPVVLWNPNSNRFVLIIEQDKPNASRNAYAFFSAATLAGPWTYHADKLLNTLPDADGVQQTMGGLGAYADGNTAYLCYTFDIGPSGGNFTNKKQGIVKLAPDFMTPLPPASGTYIEFDNTNTQTQEANRLFKRGDTYYHFASRTLGWKPSSTQYRTAGEVTGNWMGGNKEGSWSPRTQVVTAPSSGNTYDTQNSFIIPVTGSDSTTYLYVGDRWSRFIKGADQSTGRYAFFPMSFSDKGVPTIHAPGYNINGGDWLINTSTGKWLPLSLKK